MFLETLRAATDWLKDGSKGVQALAALLPRDPGEAAPIALKLITDETRDARLAIGTLPAEDQLPCFVGSLRPRGGSEPDLDLGSLGVPIVHGTVATFWQYAEKYDAEIVPARGEDRIIADGYRFLRAACKAFALLTRSQDGARLRLASQILGVEGFRLAPWFKREDTTLLIGGLEVVFSAHDHWAPT